jgi:hypothetical protein
MNFDDACSIVGAALDGDLRREIVAEAAAPADLQAALERLREGMRAHAFRAGARGVNLERAIQAYDRRTIQEGFHVLHDWDGIASRFKDEIIPVEVLQYLIETRGADETSPAVLAILLDYYFLYVLALLSMRVWDDGNANENLDRLAGLLRRLQSSHGSGQSFVADAETLLLIATSHYEPDEQGYDALLTRVRLLNIAHQTKIGLSHASSLGSHLRFGFEATYNHDLAAQRKDNVVDYSWLGFALFAAMREYSRMHEEGIPGTERERVVEAMLNGLSADAAHFIHEPPRHVSPDDAERLEFSELFQTYRPGLLEEFERLRPSEQRYSPLSFSCSFSHNIVKGMVIDAVLWGEPWPMTLNDMLTGVPGGETRKSKETLAKTLMGYARANPHRIRGKLMPVVVYDPQAGRRAFAAALRAMKG